MVAEEGHTMRVGHLQPPDAPQRSDQHPLPILPVWPLHQAVQTVKLGLQTSLSQYTI